jgi:uncharacterized protein (DUF952 family)
MTGPVVFHITERVAFAQALEEGVYAARSLEREGFVHCSTREQVLRTADRLYRGGKELVLLVIDRRRTESALRDEAADGEIFPHHYGPIPLDAIIAAVDFPSGEDGSFELPAEIQALDP